MAPELECKKRLTLGERCMIRVGGETFPVSRLVDLLRSLPEPEVPEPIVERVIIPMRPVETVVEPPVAKPMRPPKPDTGRCDVPETVVKPPVPKSADSPSPKRVIAAPQGGGWCDIVWPDYDERTEVVEEVELKAMNIVGPIARTLEANGLTTRRAIIAHGDLTPLLGVLVAGTVGRIVSDWKP